MYAFWNDESNGGLDGKLEFFQLILASFTWLKINVKFRNWDVFFRKLVYKCQNAVKWLQNLSKYYLHGIGGWECTMK